MLLSLHGLTKFISIIFKSTSAEIFVYLIEKSFIIFVAITTLIIPPLALLGVSYEWSFHQYTSGLF